MPIQPRTRSALLAGLLVGLLAASGACCAEDARAPAAPAAGPTQVRVTTNMGEFVIELLPTVRRSPSRISCAT